MTGLSVRRTHATAVIAVALVALSGCSGSSNNTSTSSSHKPSKSPSPTMSSTSSSPSASPQTMTLPVYYVADQPRGPRLFREFRRLQVSVPSDQIAAALKASLSNLPLDPDYRTDWPAGTSVISADPSGSAIAVNLTNSGADLTKLPANVTPAEANLAIQQLVYTVQAVTQKASPVSFRIDGAPAQTLLGVQVPPIVNAQPPMKVQGTVWIIDPQDGDHVGATFTVKGRGAFFEATVPWQLLQGTTVAKQGVAMAQECCKLSPFSFTVRNVRPGDYTLRVYDADQSGVEEGKNEPADTKRITVG